MDEWVEVSLTLYLDDIKSLRRSLEQGGDESGIIRHLLEVAEELERRSNATT